MELGAVAVQGGLNEISWMDPRGLSLVNRFDIAAKLAYARAFVGGRLTEYHRRAYADHIRTFNAFYELREEGEPKVGPSDFLGDFDALLESLSRDGFLEVHPIRVDPQGQPHNGAHRVAGALALGIDIAVVETKEPFVAEWDYRFFRDRGMEPQFLDLSAAALADIVSDLRVVVVFGSALSRADEISLELREHANIHYERRVELSARGCDNLIRLLYEGEPWLGRREEGYLGAASKSRPCFPQDKPRAISAMWIKPRIHGDDLVAAKAAIRERIGVGNHSMHISDTIDEARAISDSLLSEGGLHLLNHRIYRHCPAFESDLKALRSEIGGSRDPRDLCVVGSSVLSLYGLRDARDLDFIVGSHDPAPPRQTANAHWRKHGFDTDEILYSPNLHLTEKGIKFAALSVVADLKRRRAEPKDAVDLSLIDAVLPAGGGVRQRLTRLALLARLYSNRRFLRSFVGHWGRRLIRRARRIIQ